MADVQPFRALHYDRDRVGGLQPVVAPPYDVIDAEQRAELLTRSPHNVVEIDLPQGDDPYAHAAEVFERWRRDGILVRDDEDALWALEQDYTGPDGRRRTRHGFFARVAVEDYGPGRIRPHERTHPGPKEDRLRLTRATHANLSPIFSLYDDPAGAAWGALAPHLESEPWAEVTDEDGTTHRLWRVADRDAIEAVRARAGRCRAADRRRPSPLRDRARAPRGGRRRPRADVPRRAPGPGADRLPHPPSAHRLDGERRESLRATIQRDFEVAEVAADALEPEGEGPVRMGYLDAHHRRPLMLTLRDPAIAAEALPDKPEPYRALDTAVLEALVLQGALGMSEDDISHLHGLDYARDTAQARERVEAGEVDAAFFMRGTPVSQVREVAAAGESMPPKSTYFFPKVLTGMVFNLLD